MIEKKNILSKSEHKQLLKLKRIQNLEEKMKLNMKKRKQNTKKEKNG